MMFANTYVVLGGGGGNGRVGGAAGDDVLQTVPEVYVGVRCTARKHVRRVGMGVQEQRTEQQCRRQT